jgi:hypothetical protein
MKIDILIIFQIQGIISASYTLKTLYGTYLSALEDGSIGQSNEKTPNEHFEIINRPYYKVFLKTKYGTYVSYNDNEDIIHTNALTSREEFQVYDVESATRNGPLKSYESSNGHYLSAAENGSVKLIKTLDWAGTLVPELVPEPAAEEVPEKTSNEPEPTATRTLVNKRERLRERRI